ncbi:hypothetical protein [Bradyrhizobium sp. SZCCHNR3118]|uniref:hypothetical protein n=1 Tax=Bradyrhizobium sp. SZCCHNR3118 TaxID=3057468 RepID=UPI0029170EF2|nr:hypothetical protein [Bradyrhizobium sp. SZCCHNR3118]
MTMFKNVMVASSKLHASTMIAWMKLDPEIWLPLAYGDRVTQVFNFAKLVRPGEGIEQAHLDWVLEQLVPNLQQLSATEPVPPYWTVSQEDLA